MPASKNTFFKDQSSPKKKKKKKGKPFRFNFLVELFSNEKLHRVIGLFFILFSFFLFFAFLSHFFTWKKNYLLADASIVSLFTDNSLVFYNITGKLGAKLSFLFLNKWFGISSFIFTFLFFIHGIRLFAKNQFIPLLKATKHGIFYVVWISIALGFILKSQDLLTGLFGYHINIWMRNLLGSVGSFFLLLFSLASFVIIAYNINISDYFKRDDVGTDDESDSESTESTPEQNTLASDLDNSTENENAIEVDLNDDITETPETTEEKELILETDPIDLEPKLEENPKEELDGGEEEVAMTIEESPEEKTTDKQVHNTIDTEYDPTLDLSSYKYPELDLLVEYEGGEVEVNKEELEENKNKIVTTLNNYSIKIDKIKATIGPTVTLYELIPAPGIRIAKIKNLEDDIALSLAALGIRIIAPIPGKGTIGIEVPNKNPKIVSMKTLLESKKFKESTYELPIALGKTISNECYIANLASMPHLLMAGATGQGKSVGLNAVLASLLYKKHPSQIKFVLVDPKKVELTLFSKIERHFLAKLPGEEEAIITDTRKVVQTLNSLCIEMDDRYDLLKNAAARNIKEYNAKFIKRKLNPNEGHRFLPYIVLVVDEFADLIMTAGKEVEGPIARLAQLARAIGIHLIIATQRPSVNIITGTIKANFPARVAFRVTSKIDSRTILDAGGADQLIGRGDMLLSLGNEAIRLQCAFIDTPEVEKITEFIGSQRGYPDALLLPECPDEQSEVGEIDASDRDALFEEAARTIVTHQQGSTSLLQRKLKLGYNRAGRIVDQLEAAGIIGPFEGSKAREVRIKDMISLEQLLKEI